MANFWLVFGFYIFLVVNCEVELNDNSTVKEDFTAQVSAVLDHLNYVQTFHIYDYIDATVTSAQKRADFTELTLDVQVQCVDRFYEVPCTEPLFNCKAFVKAAEEGYKVIGTVQCRPYPIDAETTEYSTPLINVEDSYEGDIQPVAELRQPIALSNEAVSSEVGEHFVAVRKSTAPCVGCPFDLNPDAAGASELIETALHHVETEKSKKHALVKVLKLQQQIVSGVMYILLAEIAPTTCSKDTNLESCPFDTSLEPLICKVTYLQKPWINKAKHIIANNCTNSQEFVASAMSNSQVRNDIDNEIEVNRGHVKPFPGDKSPIIGGPNFDHIAESGVITDEMTPERMSDLESQIMFVETSDPIPKQQLPVFDRQPVNVFAAKVAETPLSAEIKPTQTHVFSSSPSFLEDAQAVDDRPENIHNTEVTLDIHSVQSSTATGSDGPSSATELPIQMVPISTEQQANLDGISSLVTTETQHDQLQVNNHLNKELTSISSEDVSSRKACDTEPSGIHTTNNVGSSTPLYLPEDQTNNIQTPTAVTGAEDGVRRPKRALRQFEKVGPEEKNFVRDLADAAASALDNIDDDNFKRIVLHVLGAKKMKDENNGVYYHLILRLGLSRCLEDKPIGRNENCREKLFPDYFKICKVQMHVYDDYINPRLAKSQCQNIKRDKNDINRTNYGRYRRQVGGVKEIPKNSTEVAKIVHGNLVHLDSLSEHPNKLKAVDIMSATSQVVSGVMYRVRIQIAVSDCPKSNPKSSINCGILKESPTQICDITVWHRPWLHNTTSTLKCEEDDTPHTFQLYGLSRSRRTVPGGISEQSLDDPTVLSYLGTGLQHLDSTSTQGNKLKIHKVLSATSQVVSGSLWKIKASVIESDCSKSGSNKNCGTLKDAKPSICDFEFWDQPWLPQGLQIKVKCENDAREHKFRAKREVVKGGVTQKSVDDPTVITYLSTGLQHLDSTSTQGNKLKVHKILSATSQVVSGSLWKIKASVIESDCSKLSSSQNCGTLKDAKPSICDFEFWDQPWLPQGLQINVKCENDAREHKFRAKRQVLKGGVTQKSVDDPTVITYLSTGLQHLDSTSTQGNKLKVHKILSATSQVVSGSLWKIKASVIESDCGKSSSSQNCGTLKDAKPTICDFEFWDQPWLPQGLQINVKCENDAREHKFRAKREVVFGGAVQKSVDDPTVMTYLGTGLQHLDSTSTQGNKLKIHKVLSATSQVVSGSLWKIKASVVESDCSKSNSNQNCGTLKDAKPSICDFEFWDQPWLPQGLQINVKCENDAREHKFRAKREVVVGGAVQKSVDDPTVMTYLGTGLQHLDSTSTQGNKLKIHKVLSATSQVVSGSLWKIKASVVESDCSKSSSNQNCGTLKDAKPSICDFEFWDQPWLPQGLQINVKCENDAREHKFRAKREVVDGGAVQKSVDDPTVMTYLGTGLQHLDSTSTQGNKLKIHKVLSATSQVVSGSLWKIKASVVESDCSKSSSNQNCVTLKAAKPTICDFEFWDQPWLPEGLKITVKCENDAREHNFRTKRDTNHLLGGQTEKSIDDPRVLTYISAGLQHLDSSSNQENRLKIDQVLSATLQIVSGSLWRIKASIVESDCSKTSTNRVCGTLENATPKICNFEFWDQPWLPDGLKISVNCEDDQITQKPNPSHPSLLGKDDHDEQYAMFKQFVKKHNKIYSSKREHVHRFKVFQENMEIVRMLNKHEQGTAKYGVTYFSDLTRDEFSKSLGLRQDLRNENYPPFEQAKIPDIDLPDEFDWRDKNVVTEVKNQQQCGSCWAFSVTGNVEGQYARKYGNLMEFSEQELVDCDTEDQGCNGGLMDTAYRVIEKLGGLETEKDYPYDAEDEKCHFNRSLAKVQLSGAVNISQDETDMAKWLIQNGPISIAINANAMQFYMGGVSHPLKFLCSSRSLDHGVLIVGYGVHTYPLFHRTLPYWIVKNSWGPSWGEQGYYRVYRGDGTCGVNQTPSSAIVA